MRRIIFRTTCSRVRSQFDKNLEPRNVYTFTEASVAAVNCWSGVATSI